jgi:DNA-binding response OmpR family regulator
MAQPKVLIVDDDADSRAVLHDALGGQPYTLLEARDGEEALDIADRELPDLILLDVLLPGQDGDLVLRKLRNTQKTKSIPVILVTALDILDSQVWASLGESDVDHIRKPVSSVVLRAKVQAILRSRAPRAEEPPTVSA